MTQVNNLNDLMNAVHLLEQPWNNTIKQAITDIRKYQDRMSIDGRAIQHIADSLEALIK